VILAAQVHDDGLLVTLNRSGQPTAHAVTQRRRKTAKPVSR